jgi:hypothetical protein
MLLVKYWYTQSGWRFQWQERVSKRVYVEGGQENEERDLFISLEK